MKSLTDIHWPGILFGRPNCVMRRIESDSSLTHLTYAGLQAINRMTEYFVVDSEGQVFHLKNVRLSNRAGPIRKVLLYLINPQVAATFTSIRPDERMTPDNLKARMLQDIGENQDYWSEVSNFEELVPKITSCMTIPELIGML